MKKVLLLLISILLLSACKYINNVNDSYIVNYLKTNYGEEKEYRLSENGTCDLYQIGYCSAYYKASDIKEDIYVVWYDGDGMDIRDDYLFKKYKSDIRDYYYNYFSKTINGKYNVEILSQKSDLNWQKNSKANDILNYEKLNLSMQINIANDDVDTSSIGETLKNLINERKVRNVSSIYVTSYNRGCNLEDTSKCKKINSSYIEVKITEEEKK